MQRRLDSPQVAVTVWWMFHDLVQDSTEVFGKWLARWTEIARALVADGHLILLWNRRDESVPWVAAMSDTLERDEKGASYRDIDWATIVTASGRFRAIDERRFGWEQPMTRVLLAERVRSISFVAVLEDDEREQTVADVVALVDGMDEEFALPYTTIVQCFQRT